MITRIWQAWSLPENADAYESLLREEIFPGILGKTIDGLSHIELLRRDCGPEVEFMTVFRFDDDDSIRAMTGGTRDEAFVPESARKVLSRFEQRARHFDTRAEIPAEARR